MTIKISKRAFLTASVAGSASFLAGQVHAAPTPRHLSPLYRHFRNRPAAAFGDKVSGRIFNYNRMSPNLGTSGLLQAGGVEEAIKLGFQTIIDMRGSNERGVRQEAALMKKLGIKRFHIPITTQMTAQDQVDQFAAILHDPANYPILAHCVSGNRVGGMWALYRAGQGIDPILAIEEARACGMTGREGPVRKMLGLPAA